MVKKVFAIILLISCCFVFASCSGLDNYPGKVKVQFWVSDDEQMYFYFPAEAGIGNAQGKIILYEAISQDIILEWNGNDGIVEVSDAEHKLIFRADTTTDKDNLTCTFRITSNPRGWTLPETIRFHWSQQVPDGFAYPYQPKQTSLDFWILQDVGNADFSDYTEITGWMGAREFYGNGYAPVLSDDGSYKDPEHCVKYLVTAWPDHSDGGQYVTRIVITDPAAIIWGLTVEATVEQFNDVLTVKGFEYGSEAELDPETEYKAVWSCPKYSVTLFKQNGKCAVIIDAPVSNRDNIIY